MSVKFGWIAYNALFVTFTSLIAAVATNNENWRWNIPLGLVVGAAWGWMSWGIFNRMS